MDPFRITLDQTHIRHWRIDKFNKGSSAKKKQKKTAWNFGFVEENEAAHAKELFSFEYYFQFGRPAFLLQTLFKIAKIWTRNRKTVKATLRS